MNVATIGNVGQLFGKGGTAQVQPLAGGAGRNRVQSLAGESWTSLRRGNAW